MKDTLRIEAKFKNARLFNAIVEASIKDKDYRGSWGRGRIAAWARQNNIQLKALYELLNLRRPPTRDSPSGRRHLPHVDVRQICTDIAAALQQDVAWLFPAELYQIRWPTGVAIEVGHERFLPLMAAPRDRLALPPTQEEQFAQEEIRARVFVALETLPSRHRDVIVRRYGLKDGHEQTLKEIGEAFGVSVERVRSIEGQAFQQLRHPAKRLASCLT